MNDSTQSNESGTGRKANRCLLAILLAAGLASTPAHADGADQAVAVDAADTAKKVEIRYVDPQLSANDARRAAYGYLRKLGYSRNSNTGTARIRSTTREGDTWIVEVAYSRGGRVLSQRAVLYVDADSALVTEVPPSGDDRRIAGN